jgi:hypothetical protein
MIKRASIILGLGGMLFGQINVVFGQRSDTVYQQLFNKTLLLTNSVNVTNIGQLGHQVVAYISDAPAKTCVNNPSTVVASLQFSYDTTTWTNFGTGGQTSAQPLDPYLYMGVGAFPFVRFNITAFDNTNCTISAWYSGTITAGVVSTQGVLPMNSTIGSSSNKFYPNIIGGFSGNGVASNKGINVINMIPACRDIKYNIVSAGATTAITIPAFTYLGLGSLHICSVAITMTADGTVKLIVAGPTGCADAPSDITPVFTLKAGIPFVLGGNLGDALPPIGNLGPTTICGVATGGNATIMMNYAFGN